VWMSKGATITLSWHEFHMKSGYAVVGTVFRRVSVRREGIDGLSYILDEAGYRD